MKKIGIIGGMGPEATAELYLRIIRIFQNKYKAKYDYDFPEIIIINLPIPDVVEDSKENENVKEMLVDAAIRLEKAGADFIAIPCNTVTIFIKEIQEAVKIKVVNIIEETVKEIKKQNLNKVGLIATKNTIKNRLYDTDFVLSEEKQKQTTNIIMNILSGKKKIEDKIKLENYINELVKLGAEKVILGCTELPLIIKYNLNTIDTIGVLAEAVVNLSNQETK